MEAIIWGLYMGKTLIIVYGKCRKDGKREIDS